MNKTMVMALALGVSMMAAAASAAGVDAYSAQSYDRGGAYHDRNDDRNGDDDRNGGYRNRDDDRDGRGYGSRRGNWDSGFEGAWQLSSRNGGSRGGWLGGWGFGGRNKPDAMLPDMIRIESSRGGLQVETASGVRLRELDWSRGGGRNGTLVAVTSGGYGTTVTQTFALSAGGRELVVHTRVSDRRKMRETTSVYHRA